MDDSLHCVNHMWKYVIFKMKKLKKKFLQKLSHTSEALNVKIRILF